MSRAIDFKNLACGITRYNSLGILTIFGPSSILLIYMPLGVKKYKENFGLSKKIKCLCFKRFLAVLALFLAVFQPAKPPSEALQKKNSAICKNKS